MVAALCLDQVDKMPSGFSSDLKAGVVSLLVRSEEGSKEATDSRYVWNVWSPNEIGNSENKILSLRSHRKEMKI